MGIRWTQDQQEPQVSTEKNCVWVDTGWQKKIGIYNEESLTFFILANGYTHIDEYCESTLMS